MTEIRLTPRANEMKHVGHHPLDVEGKVFSRPFTEDEQKQIERCLLDQMMRQRLPAQKIPPDHALYKPRPDALEHLAPDHPWRKGTVPRPAE